MAFVIASLRQLRIERTAALGLAVLVLMTAFVFALAPRVLDAVADGALRDEVTAAAPVERSIQLVAERRVRPDPRDAMFGVRTLGERYEAQFPASVESLVEDRGHQAETSRWHIVSDAAEQHFATFRFQPGIDDRLEVVAGRLPTGATSTIPYWEPDAPFEVTVLEAALAEPSAEEIGAKVGDVIRFQLDPSDRLNRFLLSEPMPSSRIALEVTGIYRVKEPDSAYWLGDTALAAPVVRAVNQDVEFKDVTPLLASDAYESYMDLTEPQELPLRYTWRYLVDPARLDSQTADAVVLDLRRLESVFSPSQAEAGDTVSLRSGLLGIVETQRAAWHSAEAVLAVVAVGPAAVGLVALALVVVLLERRRRPALMLQRGRGASSTQLSAAAAFEGLLLVLPAVALAVAVSVWLVPTAPLAPSVVTAAGVAIVAVALLVGLTVPASRLAPTGARAWVAGRRSGARRLALEGLIVGLAVVGAMLLRSRGIRGASSAGALASPDPFIAGVPALLGLAAALVAMRLYPLTLRGFAALAGWRRDLVPTLGLRQASRGGSGSAILLVLMTTVALGAFSSATLVHLDRAADAVAWQETAAAFRLTSLNANGTVPASIRAEDLPGANAAARASLLSATYAAGGVRVPFLAIEAAAYQQVAAGTPVAPLWPPELLGEAGTPIPAIVSSDLATGRDSLAFGDVLSVTIDGREVDLRVADIRPTFPSLAVGEPFIVVSIDQLETAVSGLALPTWALFLRAPDSAAGPLQEALASRAATVQLQGRSERAAALRQSPVIAAVTVGVAVAALVALAYAALAVAASLALSGAARANEVAMLRTLGLTVRQSFGLVIVEHGPTVVVSFVAGVVLGLGLFEVLRPGLGLGTVVGSPLDIPLSADPGQLLLLLAAIVAIVAVSVGLAGALQRSVVPVDALRRGIE